MLPEVVVVVPALIHKRNDRDVAFKGKEEEKGRVSPERERQIRIAPFVERYKDKFFDAREVDANVNEQEVIVKA